MIALTTDPLVIRRFLLPRRRAVGPSPGRAASRDGPVWCTFALDATGGIAAWVRVPPRTVTRDRGTLVGLRREGFDEGWCLRLAGGGALFTLGPAARFRVAALDNRALASDTDQLEAELGDALATWTK